MPAVADYPAKGKVTEVRGSRVLFKPTGTTYELLLEVAGGNYAGPIGTPVQGIVRVNGRKIWTVPSGGNFIAPIVGPPRTVQGRVRYLDERELVVQAGTPVVITLPTADSGLDLVDGSIAVDSLVNAMVLPGASFELLT